MRYESPAPIGRAEALEAIRSGDPRKTSEAIIRLALNDPDGRWVEDMALGLAESADPGVRATAATALGHVATNSSSDRLRTGLASSEAANG